MLGSSLFLGYQYVAGLIKLTQSSGAMANKFSALARDKHLGFLVLENLQMLAAYALLALAATLLAQPFVAVWTSASIFKNRAAIILRGLVITGLIHGFFTLRLVETRPYFLNEAEFGHWYYQALELIPAVAKPATLFTLFTLVPVAVLAFALFWQIRRRGRVAWTIAAVAACGIGLTAGMSYLPAPSQTRATAGKPMNVIIIGSDSLRGDSLGCNGYRPQRTDGLAQAGVSPVIDELASRSSNFKRCYTAIASTMESGVQLMSSRYPQSHGIRQMYPTGKPSTLLTNASSPSPPCSKNAATTPPPSAIGAPATTKSSPKAWSTSPSPVSTTSRST